MLRFFTNTLDRILSLLCGVTFAQIPQFIQHYMQQLSGRVDELRMQVESMRTAAGLSGKSLEQFVQKFLNSSDPDFVHQGQVMSDIYHRYESLSMAYTQLEGTQGVAQPFVFFYHIDTSLVKSTFAHFSLGLPFTIEAGVYALAGIVCCHLAFMGFRRLVGLRYVA